MFRASITLALDPLAVPFFLSSLLCRTRIGILAMLIAVLPLQSVMQLMAGLQGHRHVHTGAVPAASGSSREGFILSDLARPVRAVLERLRADQDPRLQGPKLAWVVSAGPAAGMHQHGGVFHKHSHDVVDVIDVGDPADESVQAGATAFLGWLPVTLALPCSEGADGAPAAIVMAWRDRVVAPPLTPPRG